jgi:hypothetical protein
MISFTVLDHGLYIDGSHIADFESMELAQANARTLVKGGEGTSAVIICNYTGEVEYTFDKVTEVVTLETYVENGGE